MLIQSTCAEHFLTFSRQAGGGDSEDELAKEQTEIPEEEFEKLPSAADAVWDAAGQVADKAKSLISGGTTEE